MLCFVNLQTSPTSAAQPPLLGKSIVHAVIAANNLEILEEILRNQGNLSGNMDEDGQTPLSYAALIGYTDGVQYLVKRFPNSVFKRDEDGCFPIHSAAKGGHIKIIKELHNTKRLLNWKGQNILHVAAASGKSELVSFLLKMMDQKLELLINLKDEDGNTPLHLATKHLHPGVVYIFTQDKRVRLGLQNDDGLTTLDIAEVISGPSSSLKARLTWMALKCVDAPRSSESTRNSYIHKAKQGELEDGRQRPKQNKKLENDNKRMGSLVDTHLLVATLVATVTFAAGFTLPGGYNQSDSDPRIGMAILDHKLAFKAFVIYNTAAMYSSILAIVTLIWGHVGDVKLLLVSLRIALPVLGFALTMMSVAFMMGVFVVLNTQLWLAFLVLGVGSVFLVVMLLFLVPLFIPIGIRNPVVRFFLLLSVHFLLRMCNQSRYSLLQA